MDPKHTNVNGSEYCIGRLDMFKALNAARIVSPVMPALFSGVLENFVQQWRVSRDEKGGGEAWVAELAVLLSVSQPVLDRIAQMPAADFGALVSDCLSCVEKKRGGVYGPVIAEGVPMDDVPAADALILTLQVLIREIRPIGAALFKLG